MDSFPLICHREKLAHHSHVTRLYFYRLIIFIVHRIIGAFLAHAGTSAQYSLPVLSDIIAQLRSYLSAWLAYRDDSSRQMTAKWDSALQGTVELRSIDFEWLH